MKILVLGSGAREHALVRALVIDPGVDDVHAAPGNPGIELQAPCHQVDLADTAAVTALAVQLDVDLVVVGPEAPLVAGIADEIRAAGIACYGPSQAAAALEGSKAFAKDIMHAAQIPTAMARVCDSEQAVADALDAFGAPYVVKDDQLAAGKGVVVTSSRDEALEHARTCLGRERGRVVIEEFLDGPEVSLFCVCDGDRAVPLTPAQDFKRIGEDDTGLNTGGMGAYTPLDWAPDDLTEVVMARVTAPLLAQMRRLGTPFVGTLFIGLALTSAGPKVIEFNVRFGDPETQVVLARLQSSVGTLLHAAATGALATLPHLRWSSQHAVTVVVAAANYPGPPETGEVITGVDETPESAAGYILHSGTARREDGALVSAGGRVLSVVGLGDSLAQARRNAYDLVDRTSLPGRQVRRDIAAKAERGEIVVAAKQ